MTSTSHGHDEVKRSTESTPEVETYEDDGRVVLFDAGNPLAWLEASRAITLHDVA